MNTIILADATQISIFYKLPIAITWVFFVLCLLAALETGFRVGLIRRTYLKDGEAGGGGIMLTSIFALLSLIIGFTYGFTINRYDQRRQSVIEEANALGTAFQLSSLIAGPEARALREELYDYGKTRVAGAGVKNLDSAMVKESMKAQARLWPHIKQIVQSKPPGPIEGRLVTAMNDLMDVHTLRLAAALDHLPQPVIWMLIFVASASISVAGFNAGLSGFISRWRMGVLTIALSSVMMSILDFDRPRSGFVRVSQESLKNAVEGMGSELAMEKSE